MPIRSLILLSIVAFLAAATVHASPQGEGKTEVVVSEADKAAEDMARTRADLLAKHQGADETRLTQLMGPPSEKAAKEEGLMLIWRGPAGVADPLPCRIAATLVEGGLANIELSGHPSWDKKTCRKFLRPLLQALPWRSVSQGHPADGEPALANDSVVRMVRDGVTTQAILGQVRNQPCHFDLSADGTGTLRKSGVPEVVIQAMAARTCT